MKPSTNERQSKIGRNDPCPCGSGKKYKACCAQTQSVPDLMRQAMAQHNAGQLTEAARLYEEVLRLNPANAEAVNFLGVVAQRNGRYYEALELMTRSIAIDATNAVFFLNLAAVRSSLGEFDAAIACYRKSIELDPGRALAHFNLGNFLIQKKQYPEAAASLAKAVELSPNEPEPINSLGVALEKMGRYEKSIVCYRKAISLRPDYLEAHANLGNPLEKLGQTEEAIASYKRALQINPHYHVAHRNLGTCLCRAGRTAAAIESLRIAVELAPDSVSANLNLGNAYKDHGLLTEGAKCYRRVLELEPRSTAAYTNLGTVLMEMGKVNEAEACYRKTLELEPGYAMAYTDLLYFHASMRIIPPEAERALAEGWERCALTEAERLAARKRASPSGGAFCAEPRASRKLRLGIVTAELGMHAVAEFLEPFLQNLDKEKFHLTFFPTVVWRDPRTQRMLSLADQFIGLVGVPHAQAAERIRAEKIDILMDTTGHTNNCHLGIFAHRAAPVQLTYVGYWSTTGLTEMDWFVADPDLPASFEPHFTEGLWRLPRIASCYHGDTALPQSRWEPGDTIWLGSFNRYHKVREQTLALWAKVLHALPQAKLLLEDRLQNEEETHQRILSTLDTHGVSASRVEFVPAIAGHERHMALYDRLDVALDTIPFNSGTTAFDALWMGVPLVALEGSWSGGRIASSALRALGREKWIAHSDDEYVSIVRSLAQNVEGRKAMRKSQRAMMAASPLCDAEGLTRAMEGAFEAMYDRWLTGVRSSRTDVLNAAQGSMVRQETCMIQK